MQHVNYGEDAFIVIGGADNTWVDRIGARDLTPRGTKLYDASCNISTNFVSQLRTPWDTKLYYASSIMTKSNHSLGNQCSV